MIAESFVVVHFLDLKASLGALEDPLVQVALQASKRKVLDLMQKRRPVTPSSADNVEMGADAGDLDGAVEFDREVCGHHVRAHFGEHLSFICLSVLAGTAWSGGGYAFANHEFAKQC